MHGECRHALQALRCSAAEAGVVVVARARHGDRVVDVLDRRDRQPEAAVQDLHVDAVGVHVVEPRDRVAGALLHAAELGALDLLDMVLAEPRLGVELAVHQDPGEALGVLDQLRTQVAMGVVEELAEDVDRFVDVCVGIDHQQVVSHGIPLSSWVVVDSLWCSRERLVYRIMGSRVRGGMSRDLAFPESPRWYEAALGRPRGVPAGCWRSLPMARSARSPRSRANLVASDGPRRATCSSWRWRGAAVVHVDAAGEQHGRRPERVTACQCNDMVVDAPATPTSVTRI